MRSKLKIFLKIYKKFLKKINFRGLKETFFIFSLAYFFIYYFNNSNQISFDFDVRKNLSNIVLSFLFCLFSVYLNAAAWRKIVLWFGDIEPKNNLISFYILTNILKYVPGGIWHFYERYNFIKDSSNSQVALYSTLIEPYFMLSASFLLSSLGSIFNPYYLIFIVPFFFLNKKLIYLIIRKLESLKSKAIDILKIRSSDYKLKKRIKLVTFFPAKAFFLEIGFVISKFIGFLICFNTLDTFGNHNIIYLFVIFCLSWSIGLIVPTAPSGVGVFEACFLFFIGNSIPQNIIFVSLVYFRLISTSADLFLSFPFLFRKIIKKI